MQERELLNMKRTQLVSNVFHTLKGKYPYRVVDLILEEFEKQIDENFDFNLDFETEDRDIDS